MTGFRGSDDSGRVVEDLTPETLRVLLIEAASQVIVEEVSSGTQSRARRLDTEAWRVEVGGDRPLATTAANTDAAFDILRSWAADDEWWSEAFPWEPTDG